MSKELLAISRDYSGEKLSCAQKSVKRRAGYHQQNEAIHAGPNDALLTSKYCLLQPENPFFNMISSGQILMSDNAARLRAVLKGSPTRVDQERHLNYRTQVDARSEPYNAYPGRHSSQDIFRTDLASRSSTTTTYPSLSRASAIASVSSRNSGGNL